MARSESQPCLISAIGAAGPDADTASPARGAGGRRCGIACSERAALALQPADA